MAKVYLVDELGNFIVDELGNFIIVLDGEVELSGDLSFSGSITRKLTMYLAGALSFVGGFKKIFSGDILYKILRRRKRDTNLIRQERSVELTREKRDYNLVWNRKVD